MGFKHPVVARTTAELDRKATPGGVAGQSEALPYVFYDTQTYTSGTTTALRFFQVTNTDRSISNMDAAGQLPSPQYFEVYYFGLDILEDVTQAATADAWDDIQQLVMTGRGHWTFTLQNKDFGPLPVSFLHTSGGVTGFGTDTTTAAAAKLTAYGNNSFPDGGFCVEGAYVIKPKVSFSVKLEWPSALTLSGDQDLRFWMAGTWHRAVS